MGADPARPPHQSAEFGYGFLFGMAFYLPLVRWIRASWWGVTPLLALVLVCSVFPGIFGLPGRLGAAAARMADLVRGLMGSGRSG